MKDTYETYEPQKTEGVREYEAEQARVALKKERDGAVAMAIFLPLWSAADPTSKLARFLRFAPAFCVGAPVLFAAGVAFGYI